MLRLQGLLYILTFLVSSVGLYSQEVIKSYLDEPAIEVYFPKTTTLYSEPRWDYDRYKYEKKAGRALPEKRGWAKENQRAYIINSETFVEGDMYVGYSEVYFEKADGTKVRGWINDDYFVQDLEALASKPQKKVREVLGLGDDPNDRLNDSTSTEADFCDGNCDERRSPLSNIGEYIDSVGSFKNSDELEWYTNVYRKGCSLKHHKKYVKEYRKYIAAASKSFGVPEALLTCVLFRESQFDPTAESSTGVQGIAQMTASNVSYINGIIKRGDMSDKTIANYKKVVECGTDYKSWDPKDCAVAVVGKEENRATAVKKNYRYAKQVVNELYPLAQKWKSYFKEVEKLPEYKKFVKSRYNNYETPTRFSYKLGNRYPPNAIGASALYLKSILEGIQERAKSSLNKEEAKNALVVAAVAYNAGEGDLWSRVNTGKRSGCVKLDNCNPSDWREEILSSYRNDQVQAKRTIEAEKAKRQQLQKDIRKLGDELRSTGLTEEEIKKVPEYKDLLNENWLAHLAIEDAEKSLDKADEVANHMESIDNCVSKGSDSPMSGTKAQCKYGEVK